jgi:hypothetical protein
MSNRLTLSLSGTLNVAGLLGFAATIVVQIAGGIGNYPTIPPGLVISAAVVALLILGARWWWTALAGVLWPLFLTVGGIAATARRDKTWWDNNFALVSTIAQLAFLAVALVAGALYALERYRGRVSTRARF